MDPVISLFQTMQSLVDLIITTPPEFTTANRVVIGVWTTMTAVADAFFVLILIIGATQIMYSQSTGTLSMPLSQLLAKAIVTALLIHLSFFIEQDLLMLNNLLCALLPADVQGLIRQVNGGQSFNNTQLLSLSFVLTIVAGLSFIRIIFQAVKRIVFFNVLFVLSGPAFLLSFHPQTAPWFAFWARIYVVTIFTQFLQFLTFELGFQFLIATERTGLTGMILAIALLNLTAEIPGLLSRFAATPGATTTGIGNLVGIAIRAAALLAAV
ncbi:hypothetical protein [Thermogemmatispora tikiterensis]|uniref:Uncharacterized protein n=1 Tax=Thermogemmatispora tikiterensis TaxID=1825093 RepID=A0A328VM85_9CHLR|nr:hypothetical protein [Thermogemmatispora tikiterensis]RAQ98537.1 hypothetical protein A4R35_23555 [Thermogemmatispora tikiterensis]